MDKWVLSKWGSRDKVIISDNQPCLFLIWAKGKTQVNSQYKADHVTACLYLRGIRRSVYASQIWWQRAIKMDGWRTVPIQGLSTQVPMLYKLPAPYVIC